MKRCWILSVTLFIGCSTAPLADFMDHVAPGGAKRRNEGSGATILPPQPNDPLLNSSGLAIPTNPNPPPTNSNPIPTNPIPKSNPSSTPPNGSGSPVVPPPSIDLSSSGKVSLPTTNNPVRLGPPE